MTPKDEFELIKKSSDKGNDNECKSNFIYSYGGRVYIPQSKLNYISFFLQCPPYDSSIKEEQFFFIDWNHPQKCKTNGSILSAFLISRYVCLMNEIIRSGLKKGYINREENLVSKIKGRVLHKRNLFQNVIPGHKERFYCAYQEYTEDIPINRFHKSVLWLCRQLIIKQRDSVLTPQGNPLLSHINSCLASMQDIGLVENLSCYSKTVQSPHGKLFRNYEESMEIARLIIRLKEGHFYQTESDQTFSLPNFWIYLPTMFEHYVYGKLNKGLADLTLLIQPVGSYLQRADFIVTSPKKMVIDAKYKWWYKSIPESNRIERKEDFIYLDDFRADLRELSGYARDKVYFGESNDSIPCIIVYPVFDMPSDINEKRDNQGECDDKEQINLLSGDSFTQIEPLGLNGFYKVGVFIPKKSEEEVSIG